MSRWLSVVGLGEDGLDGRSPAARVLVGSAEVLVGGKRHLALVPDGAGERLTWPTPLVDLLPEIERRRGRRVCVLATGDPLCHGVAKTLLRAFSRDDMEILPAPSAFSLACARMCWSLPECETLTLHGRPLELLVPSLQPGARVLLLSNDGGTAAKVAALLEVDVGAPLLGIERSVRDVRDRPVEHLRALYRPDRYEFEMDMQIQPHDPDALWEPVGPASA